jgi:hypothetical protein
VPWKDKGRIEDEDYMNAVGTAGTGSEGYDRRYKVTQMACWILAVLLFFNLIFVNLFALKSISLVILYNVHENHLPLNSNHSEG